MKGRAIIPLVIGLGVGLLAIKLGFDYISKAKGEAISTELAEIVISKTDIPMAMKISNDMLSTTKIPKALLPAQYIEVKDMPKVVDRVSGGMIAKGFPITPASLAPVGTPPGLVVRIPPGYRAIAVKVAEEQQAGGWLVPGARVDVSAVFQVKSPGSNKMTTMTKVILENIEVAAVGQMMGTESKEPGANVVKSVTLLVKPEDVPKLHFAQTKGKVTFAVRSQADVNSSEVGPLDEDKYLGQEDPDDTKGSDERHEAPTTAPTLAEPGPSLLNGLLNAVMNAKPAASQDESAAPTQHPFKVHVINGPQEKQKVYENQWSRTEVSDPSKESKSHKRQPNPPVADQASPTQPGDAMNITAPAGPGAQPASAPGGSESAVDFGNYTITEDGE